MERLRGTRPGRPIRANEIPKRTVGAVERNEQLEQLEGPARREPSNAIIGHEFRDHEYSDHEYSAHEYRDKVR